MLKSGTFWRFVPSLPVPPKHVELVLGDIPNGCRRIDNVNDQANVGEIQSLICRQGNSRSFYVVKRITFYNQFRPLLAAYIAQALLYVAGT